MVGLVQFRCSSTIIHSIFPGRIKFMEMLLNSESGGHAYLDFVKSLKAKAVVLEPMSGDTCMAVDGEEVPSRPMLIEVHPGLCSVVVAPDH
jgi:sphingosine kinase